jgi:hypothetical protein
MQTLELERYFFFKKTIAEPSLNKPGNGHYQNKSLIFQLQSVSKLVQGRLCELSL